MSVQSDDAPDYMAGWCRAPVDVEGHLVPCSRSVRHEGDCIADFGVVRRHRRQGSAGCRRSGCGQPRPKLVSDGRYSDETPIGHVGLQGPMDYELHAWACRAWGYPPTATARALVLADTLGDARTILEAER